MTTISIIGSGKLSYNLSEAFMSNKEFRLNDMVYPSFQLYKANNKLLHFVGILQNKDNEVAA